MARKAKQKSVQHTQDAAPAIEICHQCREFVGRNYPECLYCREIAEEPIKVAWQTLLHAQHIAPGTTAERELAANVLAHSDRYWWSEVEAAMRLTPCPSCGGPLGYGSPHCEACMSSSDMLWGRDLDYAPDGALRRNEHAQRVILRGLGQSYRYSAASIEGWRLFLPFLLHGANPGSSRNDVRYAQAIRAWINAGRGHELANCRSIEEMYAITRRGRK